MMIIIIIYAQPRICPGKRDPQTSLRIWDTNGSSNLSQMTRPCDNQQNLLNCGLCHSSKSQSKVEGRQKER